MKKLILVLALLLIAIPAWAQPNDVVVQPVPEEENWGGWVEEWDVPVYFVEGPIAYHANQGGAGELVRAFALEITVSGPNAAIDWCWFEGPYDVAPSEGDPIAEWVDDNIIIIEAASLYDMAEEEGPDPNGMLVGLSMYSDIPEAELCIDIVENELRGGIVMEDVTTRGLSNSQVCWTAAEAEVVCNEDLTEAQLTEWFDWGEPPVWCLPCWTLGDVTGDELLSFGDVIQTFNAVQAQAESGDPNGSSDATMDGLYSFGDVIKVFNNVADPCVVCP
jgi:hypothetical protein